MHCWCVDLLGYTCTSCRSTGQPALLTLHLLSHFIRGSTVNSKWDFELLNIHHVLFFCFIHLPMKMELIRSSETSAIKTQTPGNYPKRNILHSPCIYITHRVTDRRTDRQTDNSCNIHVVTPHFMKVTRSLNISAFYTHSMFICYTILTIKYFPKHHSLAGLCNWDAVFLSGRYWIFSNRPTVSGWTSCLKVFKCNIFTINLLLI